MSDEDHRGCRIEVVGNTWDELQSEALRLAEPFLGIPKRRISVLLTDVQPASTQFSGGLARVTLWEAQAQCSGRP